VAALGRRRAVGARARPALAAVDADRREAQRVAARVATHRARVGCDEPANLEHRLEVGIEHELQVELDRRRRVRAHDDAVDHALRVDAPLDADPHAPGWKLVAVAQAQGGVRQLVDGHRADDVRGEQARLLARDPQLVGAQVAAVLAIEAERMVAREGQTPVVHRHAEPGATPYDRRAREVDEVAHACATASRITEAVRRSWRSLATACARRCAAGGPSRGFMRRSIADACAPPPGLVEGPAS
jgi:hypothetical protein